jgi:hypothetical protein
MQKATKVMLKGLLIFEFVVYHFEREIQILIIKENQGCVDRAMLTISFIIKRTNGAVPRNSKQLNVQ